MQFWVAMPAFACFTANMASANAGPDAQSWDGPGWYITGFAPPAYLPNATADYILLEGLHELRSGCLHVYDQLYFPIGVCRFRDAKPVAFVG